MNKFQQDSFEGAKKWVSELKENEELNDAHFVLVCNKIDVEDERKTVPYSEGKEFAEQQNMSYFEVSAKSGAGIHELFDAISLKMLQDYMKQRQRQLNMKVLLRDAHDQDWKKIQLEKDGGKNGKGKDYISICSENSNCC